MLINVSSFSITLTTPPWLESRDFVHLVLLDSLCVCCAILKGLQTSGDLLFLLESIPDAQECNGTVAVLTLPFPIWQAGYFLGCRPVHCRAESNDQVVFLKVRTSISQTPLGFSQKHPHKLLRVSEFCFLQFASFLSYASLLLFLVCGSGTWNAGLGLLCFCLAQEGVCKPRDCCGLKASLVLQKSLIWLIARALT